MEGLNKIYGRGLDYVVVPGSFRPDGVTGIAANSTKGQGFSVARSGVGLYTVTFDEKWPAKVTSTKGPGLIAIVAGMRTISSAALANAGVVDQANKTAQIRVYQNFSGGAAQKGIIPLPLGAFQEQDGTALADVGAGPTPGWSAGDESGGIAWQDHANPDPISTQFMWPADTDTSVDAVLHVVAAKVGATVGDAVVWVAEAFNNVVGALYDADADYGGESSAMTGDAATKTVQEETLTLLAAALPATFPAITTLTLQPKDGLLGTDDVILLGAWIEYTKIAGVDLTDDPDNEVNFVAFIQDCIVAA
ncbi:MAG: hypothetical protein JRH20_24780 [Deltaproteobacteria bacterium]|nr:hypothetical protein [Deltaproteobacteria bacterium]